MLAAGYILTQGVETHFEEEDRFELSGKLELIQNLFKHASSSDELDHLSQQLDDALVGHHGLAVVVTDATGNIWFATSGADFPRTLLQDCQARPPECTYGTLHQWKQDGVSHRGMAVSINAGSGKPYTVAVAQDIKHHEIFMDKFRSVLGFAIALAALAMASLGWIVTRWGLLPLRQVTDTVAGISADRLGARLPAAGLPTELMPLAAAFNAMLARLDDSFRRLSEFSSDIAHELRDMLYLAQTDNGLLKPGLEPVNLVNETQGLFDYFEAWAEERGVSLTLTGSATVPGDRLMLRRAFSNLISNAIRHTPHGQTVRVSLAAHGDKAIVTVENPGSDIPAEHLPRLFDRFYRIDPSRQRKGDGAGLGLAIVKSIIDAHGGSITVMSADQTTRFQLTLPALAE
ncbi:MAG: two-component sensor histidine kinase [Hydrogenophilales bacterium 12-63-5]|nr:MAG: two-component sensor histidine kinase [Hydrogenophilales bacterium 12-63-5]